MHHGFLTFRTMKPALVFLLLSFSMLIHAQKRDTLSLYFDIDQSSAEGHRQRIDSLCGTFAGKTYNVWIFGYSDFLHSHDYNRRLSQKRADHVKAMLLRYSSEPQMTIIACEGKGEKNSSDNGSVTGEPRQRRVDVITEVRPMNRVTDTRPTKLRKPDTAVYPTNIDVRELKKTGKLVLEGLSFIPGRHTLMKKSEPVLQGLLTTMLQNPELNIEIQGHICCWEGPGDAYDYDSDDMQLSHNRAKVVYDYLVIKGVDSTRLKYKGYGHSRPKVREVSPETEQVNRRVEIRVLE